MAACNRAAYYFVAGRPNPAGPPLRGGHSATPLVGPPPQPGSVSGTEEVHMVVTAASAAGDPDPGIDDPIAPLEVAKETKNPEGGNKRRLPNPLRHRVNQGQLYVVPTF
jgi:hypothetical protein